MFAWRIAVEVNGVIRLVRKETAWKFDCFVSCWIHEEGFKSHKYSIENEDYSVKFTGETIGKKSMKPL